MSADRPMDDEVCPEGWCGPYWPTADGWVCVDCGEPWESRPSVGERS